jgi:hypothetical protein
MNEYFWRVFKLATCFFHTSYIAPARPLHTDGKVQRETQERQNTGNIWWEMVKPAEKREMIGRNTEENLCS